MPGQLTTDEVADILGVSTDRVRRLASQHGLGRKLGPIWVFTLAEVAKLAKRPLRGSYDREAAGLVGRREKIPEKTPETQAVPSQDVPPKQEEPPKKNPEKVKKVDGQRRRGG